MVSRSLEKQRLLYIPESQSRYTQIETNYSFRRPT